ncbi:hypothetical protein ACPA0F_14040 [Solibacillus silvestris]
MTLDIGTATAIASSPAIWTICCILLVGFILKKVYEKNDKQEERQKKIDNLRKGKTLLF